MLITIRTPARRRRWLAATVAALPLALAGAAVPATVTPVAGAAAAPPGWAGQLWSGSAPGGTEHTLGQIRTIIGADTGAAASLTGAGVGVALVDTGVAPVPGLPPAQIRNGPDLSFESQSADLRYLDTYGHGTHLAGIIIGNDTATGTRGIAPGARLTSIKVGTASGAVDVSQVIAAIDWVVQHKNDDPGYPIRVLNLSYGTGGNPVPWTDPVQAAAEQAWQSGILVVAAVGNDGNDFGKLTNPATDPFVLSVGATSPKGTTTLDDDELTTFTNLAAAGKPVDVLAPGESVVSLRDPGSNIDTGYPGARVGENLFRGSGTSQAAAVTSAAAALLFQARPSYTPDQVKSVLRQGPYIRVGRGAGIGMRQINVTAALVATPEGPPQSTYWPWSTGDGKVEDARGTSHVMSNSVALSGEKSVFGAFNSAAWAVKSKAHSAWSGGLWMGVRAAGDGWTGTSFASKTWGAATWTAAPWGGGGDWVDPSWSGRYWTGRYWTAGSWSGRYWTSDHWAAAGWPSAAGAPRTYAP
ncbi:S8 family serine peptidase [Rhizomonospora bruguierae]|uniref:S8 family serine peptidase n=1 Tax=Rhizomonospora bruguierae TaxID=1581705 RepID=UPI001BCAE678|nr:S8 family serine peptidase [Micromonospora sp. NBRC 107566]